MQRSSQIYVLDSVDAFVRPAMYRLRTLKNKRIPGHWYASQLRQTVAPTAGNVFKIAKIHDEKREKGKLFWYCSFQGYGCVVLFIFVRIP
jgi:hypothetical protein